jgi:hypothetical protein
VTARALTGGVVGSPRLAKGGGVGSLAAAAFMIRDGKMPGEDISIFEASPTLGGSLDGAGDPERGYSLRGGRMLTTDNYECMWDLYKTIPSLDHEGQSVFAACTSRPNYLSMGVLLRGYRCSQPEGFARARRAPTIQQGGRLGGALPLRGVGPWAPVDGLHKQHRRDGHRSPRTHGATARAEALLLPPRSPARSLAQRRNGATCPAFERARGRHVPIMPSRSCARSARFAS